MKGKPAIAYQKYVVNDFYDWLNHFAFGRGRPLFGAIKLQQMVLLNVFEFSSVAYKKLFFQENGN